MCCACSVAFPPLTQCLLPICVTKACSSISMSSPCMASHSIGTTGAFTNGLINSRKSNLTHICQWFHFEDHRLDDAVQWLRRLGITSLRTGLSWADSLRPQALAWFDRQMQALEEFNVTLTFCFTPESRGVIPHYTSPPQHIEE